MALSGPFSPIASSARPPLAPNVARPAHSVAGAYRRGVTEQQAYEVVSQYDGFELRRYPSAVVAEISVDATFEQAGTVAFQPLVQYIGGRNRSRAQMAMTAPVVQGQKIAMTAPVVQSAGSVGQHMVAFVLPAELTEATAPEPEDPRVRIRTVPESLTAVSRYSGRWSEASYDAHLASLLRDVAAAGLAVTGSPRFARFNPPFTPWFLRRNEVHVDVRDA